ncbi:MAG: hypothetical protein HY553_08075, partial [Elusimicrobia bacterium]|nr:hypothetical protein [Elusimicrobiota bacterium]
LPTAPAPTPQEPPKPVSPEQLPEFEVKLVTPPAAEAPKAALPPPASPPPPPPAPALAAAAPTPAEPPKPTEPPKAAEPPKPAEPPKAALSPKPVEAPTPGAAAATGAGGPAIAVEPPAIPDNTPPDQIRRIAFLFAGTHKAKMTEFITFLDTVAVKVSKKPMYVERPLLCSVSTADDPKRIIDRAKESGAKGAIAILDGLPDGWIRELDEAASEQDFFFRVVAAGDVAKRSAAVELLVDMMLLPG